MATNNKTQQQQIGNLKPVSTNGPRLASFSITLESGMIIYECTLLRNDKNEYWIALPQRAYKDNDNKTRYADLIRFVDPDTYHRFQNHVLDVFHSEHPELFRP